MLLLLNGWLDVLVEIRLSRDGWIRHDRSGPSAAVSELSADLGERADWIGEAFGLYGAEMAGDGIATSQMSTFMDANTCELASNRNEMDSRRSRSPLMTVCE
jgi:hypothetical protein